MNAQERELLRLWRELPDAAQHSLLDYAAFLQTRQRPEPTPLAVQPLDIPRPAEEGVIAAIRRLRKTYPMLEHDAGLLSDASAQMTRHLVHGHAAPGVIDALEAIFRSRYEAQRAGQEPAS